MVALSHRRGDAQGHQRQIEPRVHQEKDEDTHPCQEEGTVAEPGPGGHEESGCQDGVSHLPHP